MTDTLVFSDYRPEDKGTIVALLGAGHSRGYVAEKRAVFDWQFLANPQAAGQSPFIVGTVDDDIVAVNGLMPVSARAGGKPVAACWSVDTYVSSRLRGRGFGKSLLEQVTACAPVMLGFGISDKSDPLFAKLGWRLDPTMATMFFHANELGLKGASKNLLTRLSRVWRRRRGCAAEFAVESSVPMSELATLWDSVLGHYPNAVERNGAYLTWRYRESPVLHYRWVTARQDGELRALLITRHHAQESVVADYVGPLDQPGLLAGLVDFACHDLVNVGTQRIRCEANHPAVLDALAAAGFRRYHTANRFRVFAQAGTPWTPSEHWFVMTGDSDNDLLVL